MILDTCLKCGQPMLPDCAGCSSRHIIRLGPDTTCLDCKLETRCPCVAGYDLNTQDDDDGDGVAC